MNTYTLFPNLPKKSVVSKKQVILHILEPFIPWDILTSVIKPYYRVSGRVGRQPLPLGIDWSITNIPDSTSLENFRWELDGKKAFFMERLRGKVEGMRLIFAGNAVSMGRGDYSVFP